MGSRPGSRLGRPTSRCGTSEAHNLAAIYCPRQPASGAAPALLPLLQRGVVTLRRGPCELRPLPRPVVPELWTGQHGLQVLDAKLRTQRIFGRFSELFPERKNEAAAPCSEAVLEPKREEVELLPEPKNEKVASVPRKMSFEDDDEHGLVAQSETAEDSEKRRRSSTRLSPGRMHRIDEARRRASLCLSP